MINVHCAEAGKTQGANKNLNKNNINTQQVEQRQT